MRNDFSSHAPSATMAATGSFVVVPSAVPFVAGSIRAVTISGAGTIAWLDGLGVQQDTSVLPAGTYTMTAKAILVAGTTATGITGWF